ncbi:MAG TPA: sigma 54-interacting transcriptional regulator [Planctomycetota bacterium]|nr:sigma 54-interacting transcriptional regulator [Planctomycetota bacterium]
MAATIRSLVTTARRRRARLIAVVAGSGECAKSAVQAEADALIALNAGIYRNMGHGSLAAFFPFGNANEQTWQLLRDHLLPHAGDCPVVAGLFGEAAEPDIARYLEQIKSCGVNSVCYWPSAGHWEGNLREAVEAEGLGVAYEIETLRWARSLGFETSSFAYSVEDAVRLAESGVDWLVLSMGITRGVADIREKRDDLQESIQRLNEMHAAVQKCRRPVPCLAYGGPVTTPEDAEQLFRFSDVDGFAGGTVFERLPLRDITGATVRRFKSVAAVRAGAEGTGLGEMLGRCAPMSELFQLMKRVAPYDVSVCVEGETGTGKELVATQLHRMSHRAHQPFVTLNCGALPETLLESELFGHEKGAFTGAERRRLGKFELAHRGTLFLDEVASLSPHGQVALLRALQQREITRIGGETLIPVDVRVVAASNVPLAQWVARGRFRADLYHRLNQITLNVPPLRERGEDIPLLVNEFLQRLEIQLNRKLSGLSDSFWKKLHAHAWPGNVRELQHAVLHAALREDGPLLEGTHFVPSSALAPSSVLVQTESAAIPEGSAAWRHAVVHAMREARGNKSRAAAALGVTRKTLYKWLSEMETGVEARRVSEGGQRW